MFQQFKHYEELRTEIFKKEINLEGYLNHSLFKKVGDLLLENTENYDLDFDYYIQQMDSSIFVFNYIQFIDYFYDILIKYIPKEDLKNIIYKIFKENNLEKLNILPKEFYFYHLDYFESLLKIILNFLEK